MNINKHSNRKRRTLLTLASLGVAGWIFVTKFYTAINYPDQNYPYYSATYALVNSKPVKNLTVVSYNIWFAEDTSQAISEMREIESQNGLDIVLLQEMDEVGSEKIARELQMNYIYFPAAIEPTYNKKFGNAILSRWPIIDAQKLILPHKSLSNRMNRIATRATIRIDNTDVLVYSVHTESIFTLPQFREDQYKAVLDDVDPEAKFVIIGGDFNSFTDKSVGKIENTYSQAGFSRASEGSGNSVIKYGIELTSDHIFAKGFVVEKAGKLTEATASDHLPIWVKLTLNK
jgi:endonuclease/exonuclease/phosphatase family metal-dependent hydrolase